MTNVDISTKRPSIVALSLGILGGAALSITIFLTTNGRPPISITYAVLVISIFATLRAAGWVTYFQRFVMSFLTYMVATIIMYIFVLATRGLVISGPVLWMFGLISGIGVILSLSIAYLANIGRERQAKYAK